ncbi:MAG: GspE/PulE family protein [bacterium]|nr:GspE/PulE family protein [bacterium]
MTLLEALVDKKIISKSDLITIKEDVDSGAITVEAALRDRGITEDQIMKVKSEFLGVPVQSIPTADTIKQDILDYIPEESAIHYKFVPLKVKEGVLEIGLVDPDNIEARDALSFISAKINMPYKAFLISETDFEKVLQAYRSLSAEVTRALDDLDTELRAPGEGQATDVKIQLQPGEGQEDSDPLAKQKPGIKADTKIVEDAPVTKIVATILRYASEGAASDIHIEALRDNVRVRFRVDGILNTSLVLPNKVHAALTARIKILSNMRLDEKRKPQDGRFSAKIEGRKIDFRVSTFPTYFGEKVVMRILDQEKAVKNFDDMGMTERNLALIKSSIKKPYGLILISGPTGSGKTTTLYSMLSLVDRERKNVLSLEDPIEYNMDGVNQSQVRPEIGYTFATGLRTTLRQDPNVILVGEIRDKETAQLAVQAALTGHLVLSTIHTNSAVGVIPRLMDMGVDPYLIAPTLVLAVGQRLAAQLCPGAGKEIPVDGSIKVRIEKQFEDLPKEFRESIVIPQTIREVEVTSECPSGTRGRAPVFEMFEMDKDIERAILSNATELEISKIVRQKGMLSMREDAWLKAFKGVIPIEEVNKL